MLIRAQLVRRLPTFVFRPGNLGCAAEGLGLGPHRPSSRYRPGPLGPTPDTVLVTDDRLDALVMVDLLSGERVIVSGHALN